VDAHFKRQFSWQTTDNRGEESLASTAHMGHEFYDDDDDAISDHNSKF